MSDIIAASLITGGFGLAVVVANSVLAARAARVLAAAADALRVSAESNHIAVTATAEIARLNVELLKAHRKGIADAQEG